MNQVMKPSRILNCSVHVNAATLPLDDVLYTVGGKEAQELQSKLTDFDIATGGVPKGQGFTVTKSDILLACGEHAGGTVKATTRALLDGLEKASVWQQR